MQINVLIAVLTRTGWSKKNDRSRPNL